MAILQIDPFATGAILERVGTGGTISVQSTVKHSSSPFALKVNPATTAVGWAEVGPFDASGANVQPSWTSLYLRGYFLYVTKPASDSEEIFSTFTGGNRKLIIRLDSAGKLSAYNGTTLISTGSTVLDVSTWYKIGIHLNASTGAWEIQIDGSTELSGTTAFPSGNITAVVWGKRDNRNSQTVEYYWANPKYDDAGFPADSNVAVLKADGNGTYTAWTGTFADIDDDPPPDNDDTYISTSNDPDAETATIESSASGGISGTINAVKAVSIARQAAQTVNLIARFRSNTTESDTTGVTAGTTYVALGQLFLTDPATSSPWTTGGVDGIQVGVVHNQSQTREARCTAVYAIVDYTPAAAGGEEEASATINGAASVSGVGRSIAHSFGVLEAQALVSGAGQTRAKSAGSIDSAATFSGVGATGLASFASIDGQAAVDAVAHALARSIASIDGQATFLAVGQSINKSSANIAAQASLNAKGQAIALALATIAGAAVVSGVGDVQGNESESSASINGVATVQGVARALVRSSAFIDGVAAVLAAGQARAQAISSISGEALVSGVGRAQIKSAGAIDGSADVSGVGAKGLASAADILGQAIVEAVSGTGATFLYADASINGSSTVQAVGRLFAHAAGLISSSADVQGVSGAIAKAAATILGAATVSAVGSDGIPSVLSRLGTGIPNVQADGTGRMLVTETITGVAVPCGIPGVLADSATGALLVTFNPTVPLYSCGIPNVRRDDTGAILVTVSPVGDLHPVGHPGVFADDTGAIHIEAIVSSPDVPTGIPATFATVDQKLRVNLVV